MRFQQIMSLALLILLSLFANAREASAESMSTNCGAGQTCTITVSANSCSPCNATYLVTISNVAYVSSNRTLQFKVYCDCVTATTNVSLPKSAVLNQGASNIKVYLEGSQVPPSQVMITSNSTFFFTAFSVGFPSPGNAAITLGIPIASLSALVLVLIGVTITALVTISRLTRSRPALLDFDSNQRDHPPLTIRFLPSTN